MRRRFGRISFEDAVIAVVAVIGFVAAAGPISGNTMLLHLRTGVDMFADGAIPRSDPYSFTASGDPWLVQSWFAEWTYGALERVGGWHAVIFEQMVLTFFVTLVIALLARSGSMSATAGICVVALTIGIPEWTARPALFGVACFAATVFVIDRGRSPWWLLPIGWLWVNTHGSFPLGVLWFVLTAAGSRLDRDNVRPLLKPGLLLVGGLLLGCLNPLGPKLLTFSLRVTGERREIFDSIVEWGSPNFHSIPGVLQLVAVGVTISLLITRRISWRYALPCAVFLIAALFSARNVGLLAIVLVPALRQVALPGDARNRTASVLSNPLAIGVSVVLALAMTATVARVAQNEAIDLKRYPVDAVGWMDENGLLDETHRVATQDTTGCYRIFRDGAEHQVFIDDRYDMYPADVSRDYLDLLRGTAEPDEILDRHRIDVVLWAKQSPLSHVLNEQEAWERVYEDDDWFVFTR